jgi:NADH-quinone oxidoreductase subunit N
MSAAPADWVELVRILLPFLALFGAGCAVLALGLFAPPSRGERRALGVGVAGLAASAWAAAAAVASPPAHALPGGIVFDGCAAFLHAVILVATGASLFFAGPFLRRTDEYHAEFPALLLFAASGMSLFVSTTDLLMLFLALELLSLPIYVLAGYQRGLPRSSEAALKYFLLGAFSSALFLYGIALVYGATGGLDIARMAGRAETGHLLPAGLVLVLSGFLFKIAAVPFHMWAPDVYEGAPTPVTGFMATAVKTAGFGALLRFVWGVAAHAASTPLSDSLATALSTLAIVTMTVGNLGALTQPNVKRMLAFSSIAHAGYLLVGVAAVAAARGRGDAGPILYYLLAYTVTNLAAFGVVVALGEDPERAGRERTRVHAFAGAARRHPALAFVMALAMLSLAGVPPTAGFFGKYFLFREAVAQGLTNLAVWGALNSALSLAYYLGVIVAMYMRPEESPMPAARGIALRVALALLAIAIVWAGVGPSGPVPGLPDLVRWAENAVAVR